MSDEPQLNAHNKAEYPPMHTTEHILNKTMVNMFGCERSKNAHIERKKSKCDYHLAQAPSPEQVAEIERKVNEVIASHSDVTIEFVKRDQIPEDVDLSKLPDSASETLHCGSSELATMMYALVLALTSKIQKKSHHSKLSLQIGTMVSGEFDSNFLKTNCLKLMND